MPDVRVLNQLQCATNLTSLLFVVAEPAQLREDILVLVSPLEGGPRMYPGRESARYAGSKCGVQVCTLLQQQLGSVVVRLPGIQV